MDVGEVERLSSELGFVDVLSASRHYKELGSTAKKMVPVCLLLLPGFHQA